LGFPFFLFSSSDSYGRPAMALPPQSAMHTWHSALWCLWMPREERDPSLITVASSFSLAAVSFLEIYISRLGALLLQMHLAARLESIC
jgi:hypothetical protein